MSGRDACPARLRNVSARLVTRDARLPMLSGQGGSRGRVGRSAFLTEDLMAQFPLTKTLTSITVTRHDGEYQLQIED